MIPFTTLDAVAAAVPIFNIDTDMLVPARSLKTISRAGLAEALFYNLRTENPDFPLNLSPWKSAGIIIALDNFGCGSSREHAPRALLDFGIRCIVAPSFADIFRQNCLKNGILPVEVAADDVSALMARATSPITARMTVSLVEQCIVAGDITISFSIDAERRDRLLKGLDDVALSLSTFTRFSPTSRQWKPRFRGSSRFPKGFGRVQILAALGECELARRIPAVHAGKLISAR